MLELYKNIKARRKQLKMRQEDLAEKLGYTDRSTISKIEAGLIDIPQSKIVEFAKALNTTPSELMGWDENSAEKIQDELFKKRKLLFDKSAKASPEDLDKIIKIVDTLIGEGFE